MRNAFNQEQIDARRLDQMVEAQVMSEAWVDDNS
jgi:hypothetical protein